VDKGRQLADIIDFNARRAALRGTRDASARTATLDEALDGVDFGAEADVPLIWHEAPMPSPPAPGRRGGSILCVAFDSIAVAWFGLLVQSVCGR
jgi:hypothetical protein